LSIILSNQANNPIGLFDSGVGGTSIWKEVIQWLPNEKTIYLADSKNAPYGTKPKKKIIELCRKNIELLLSLDCKLIIVACNTATTNAIDLMRSEYNVPFVGIEPAIKPASLASKTGRIGILATQGTLDSKLFHATSQKWLKDIKIIKQKGTGIVDLIESGKLYSEEMTALVKKYSQVFTKANVDYLVLGCSHYPYLIPQLKRLLPAKVNIIDSGLAVAKQTKKLLEENKLLRKDKDQVDHQFFTNTNSIVLIQLLGEDVKIKKRSF